ncbi:hypothetical protein PTKIN_Ptkin07bG0302700 [Pterospermum kingtungense]
MNFRFLPSIFPLIVEWPVKEDASYQRGLICAKGRAEVAVPSATVFPRVPQATMSNVPAMPI